MRCNTNISPSPSFEGLFLFRKNCTAAFCLLLQIHTQLHEDGASCADSSWQHSQAVKIIRTAISNKLIDHFLSNNFLTLWGKAPMGAALHFIFQEILWIQ